MKKLILLLPLLILVGSIAGIFILDDGKSDTENQPTADKNVIHKLTPETISFDQVKNNYFSLNALAATSHGKMRVYPIIAGDEYLKDHKHLDKFLNLAEALKEGKIEIMEVGKEAQSRNSGAMFNPNPLANPIPIDVQVSDEVQEAYANGSSVNTLTIENKSDEPIYIMAGEVVQGGKQDRVIAEDIIAMPHSGKIAVPVFCVEPSRWSYRKNGTPNSANNNQGSNIYAFTGYFNVASNGIRQTVKRDKDQSAVWSQVGEMRNRHNVNNQNSSTYGDLANSKAFNNKTQEYLTVFSPLFDNAENVVGCMVVSGDKILGTDVFASPELFKKQYQSLLHSYVSESITYGKPINLSDEQVQNHFNGSVEKYFTTQADEKAELALKFVHDGKVVHFTDL